MFTVLSVKSFPLALPCFHHLHPWPVKCPSLWMSIHLRFLFIATDYSDLDLLCICIMLIIASRSHLYFSLTANIDNWACFIYFVPCSIKDSHLGHCLDHFLPGQPSLTKSATGLEMSFGLWWLMMIIYGLSMSIRHIHASDNELSWWLVLLLWLSAFTGFIIIIIIIIILAWMGPQRYGLIQLCD